MNKGFQQCNHKAIYSHMNKGFQQCNHKAFLATDTILKVSTSHPCFVAETIACSNTKKSMQKLKTLTQELCNLEFAWYVDST